MLEARALTVAYGARVAVGDIDLAVRTGELVALCGPNGSGKSTIIGALSGDVRGRGAARVSVGGADVATLSARALARRRAVLEQSPSLSAPFTVAALVALAIPREIAPDEAAAIGARALARVDLGARREDRVADLSGGQRRRAHLARALAQLEAGRALGGGEALLLDEPTAGLDPAHQIKVIGAARDAADRGTATLVALHDLTLAGAYADRIVLLRAGRIVAEGSPAAVLRADLLSDVYQTEMTVFTSPDGALHAAPALTPANGALHVSRDEPFQDPQRQGAGVRGGVAHARLPP